MARGKMIAIPFALSVLGSVWFAAAYALHDGPQFEGLGLFVALAGLALGIVLWAEFAMPHEQVVDVRDTYPSLQNERLAAERALEYGADEPLRACFWRPGKFRFVPWGRRSGRECTKRSGAAAPDW